MWKVGSIRGETSLLTAKLKSLIVPALCLKDSDHKLICKVITVFNRIKKGLTISKFRIQFNFHMGYMRPFKNRKLCQTKIRDEILPDQIALSVNDQPGSKWMLEKFNTICPQKRKFFKCRNLKPVLRSKKRFLIVSWPDIIKKLANFPKRCKVKPQIVDQCLKLAYRAVRSRQSE